jgi:hypothetical protein
MDRKILPLRPVKKLSKEEREVRSLAEQIVDLTREVSALREVVKKCLRLLKTK